MEPLAAKSTTEALSAPEAKPISNRNGIYLSRVFLLGFTLSFAAMIAALEAINYIFDRNQGFPTAGENWHYLWTYGPTMST